MLKRFVRLKRLHALAESDEMKARIRMVLAQKEVQKEQALVRQVGGYIQDYQSILKPNQALSSTRFSEFGLFLSQLNTMLLAANDRLANAEKDLMEKDAVWQQKKVREKSLARYCERLQEDEAKYMLGLEQTQADERNNQDFLRKSHLNQTVKG